LELIKKFKIKLIGQLAYFESKISGFDEKYGIIGKNRPSLELFVVFCYFENNSKVCPLKVCKAARFA